MKLLPILLLNVVTVGAGLVIYDQVRQDAPVPSYDEPGGFDSDVISRIEALERARSDNAPMLQAKGADPRVLARLDELESRLGKARSVDTDTTEESGGASPTERLAAAPEASGEGPSDEEVKRFRELTRAAREQEREEREMKRIDDVLATLEISLSDKQRTQLHTSYRDFSTKRNEIYRAAWQKAQEDGIPREQMRDVMRETGVAVQQEFASVISSFIPSADAQKISESLNARGGMRGTRAMGLGR